MEELAIETSQLTKKFGDFTAVNALDLKVRKGEVYGLLGPNGAGKTTVIKVLCGLLKMNGGSAKMLGTPAPSKSIAGRIGYMPQETALYVGLTVRQNLEFFGSIFGLGKAKVEARISELLKVIDLEVWAKTLVNNLSGGMKHRVSLACALMSEPEILFLDEPTVGVDPELRASFWQYFQNLRSQGITILITTHYMDEARHCDRIGFMRNGKLIAEGSPTHLLESTRTTSLEDAFLEVVKEVGP